MQRRTDRRRAAPALGAVRLWAGLSDASYSCEKRYHLYKKEENSLLVTDLLADVVIYPDGYIKVLDINELAVALEKKLCEPQVIIQALNKLDQLLNTIYDDKFDTLSVQIEKWISN